MARRNFASNNCKGTFSYRKSNKKWTRVKRMIVVLTTTGKLPYFCDDKCRNFTIHCSSTAALLLYMMDHYQSRWQWRRQSPWQNIGGIRALVLLLGCKKSADTQLRAQARGRFDVGSFYRKSIWGLCRHKNRWIQTKYFVCDWNSFHRKIFWKIVALNVIVFMLQNVNKGKGREEIDFFKSPKKVVYDF